MTQEQKEETGQHSTKFTRRNFIKVSALAGLGAVGSSMVFPFGQAFASFTGTLSRSGVKARFAIGSDIHLASYGSPAKFQHALQTFYKIDPSLDAIALIGDLVDNGNDTQYAQLMSILGDSTYNTGSAELILCQGNHETYTYGADQAPTIFKQKTGQDANKAVKVNGVTVITLGPQTADDDYIPSYSFLQEQLAVAQTDAPESPILVLCHHSISGTAYTSDEWYGEYGEGTTQDLVQLMQRYPQIIHISGHSHATVEDARSIDQSKGFTCIQDGTLGAYFENESGKVDPDTGSGATVPPHATEATEAIILDVMNDDTAVVYRLNLQDDAYIYEPWTIDVPAMVVANGNTTAAAYTYLPSRASSLAPVPATQAVVTMDSPTSSSAMVHFPTVDSSDDDNLNMVHGYEIVLTSTDSSAQEVTKRIFADYYRVSRRSTWDVEFLGLAAATTYDAKVYAQTSFVHDVAGDKGTSQPMVSSQSITTLDDTRVTPRAILDIDYRTGSTADAMGHTALLFGGALVTDATLGHLVLQVDGNGGWRYTLDASDYDYFTGHSTCETYFNLNDVQSDQCVFSNQQSAGAGFEVENGELEYWFNSNDSGRCVPATPITAGTWYHAVATYDGTNLNLYLNGELKVTKAAAGGMKVPSIHTYFVGADPDGNGSPTYDVNDGGKIALARLYPRVFSVDEVVSAYRAAITAVLISAAPQSASYTQETSASPLSVTASGAGTLAYQWYSNSTNSNSGGVAIAGATSSTYTPSTSDLGTTYYYVVVSEADGSSATSVTAAITVSTSVFLADGTYTIGSETLTLDVPGASVVSGIPLQLYTPNGTTAQQFSVARGADSYYTITALVSGKVLDVVGGDAADGTTVQQYAPNGTLAQKWAITTASDGVRYTVVSALDSNYVLDIQGGSMQPGARVQIYSANGTDAQAFTFTQSTFTQPVADGTYKVTSALGGVLDVAGDDPSDGTRIQLYSSNGTAAQAFTLAYQGDGTYIVSTGTGSGKVLDVQGGGTAPGTPVWQYSANGTLAQRWVLSDADNGYFILVSACDGLALDVTGANPASGTPLQVYTPNGTQAQLFRFDTPRA